MQNPTQNRAFLYMHCCKSIDTNPIDLTLPPSTCDRFVAVRFCALANPLRMYEYKTRPRRCSLS